MCFTELQKAHGSVEREILGVVLARFGVPEKMLTFVRQFHEGMQARVHANDDEYLTSPMCCGEDVYYHWFFS